MPRKASRVKRRLSKDIKLIRNPEEAAQILEEVKQEIAPVVEVLVREGRRPGMIVGGTKVSYNYQTLCDMFPIVTFTPEETTKLTFQGVPVQCRAGIEMHVPSCYKEIYNRHRANLRKLPDLDGVSIDPGAGGLT